MLSCNGAGANALVLQSRRGNMASFYEQPCEDSEDSTQAWIIFLNDST